MVVAIDTDAPVPNFVGRLRIDTFDMDGRWLESGDVARPDPSDWPASFSLFTHDRTHPHQVLLRARAYLEGRVREYHGERFEERTPYVEPWAANTLSELCEDLPELVLGQELTLRRGSRRLTGFVKDAEQCRSELAGGVVAARLDVREAGEYRLETTRVNPSDADTSLFIRTDCRDARTQLACNNNISDDPFSPDLRSRLVLQLQPGSYTVLSGNFMPAPSDITLRADLTANWLDTPAPATATPVLGSQPRLSADGVDGTPRQEPQPLVTIDRLALITLEPGRKQSASIVLHTACGGQMAKLSAAASDAAPVLAEAETCIDTEGARVPVVAEEQAPFTELARSTRVGAAAQSEACPEPASAHGAVCIPAGAFVFGSPHYAPYPVGTTPERFALMSRYWLDETEVTVGRWRAALARGFESPTFSPFDNDKPLDPEPDNYYRHCTFSLSAQPAGENREDYPLNCIDLDAARAFCQFHGGDLPTEAQWQYAATKAGRSDEIDDYCVQAGPCLGGLANPVAVTDPVTATDITKLGVRGLGGNLAEWVLDSFYALDAPCWNGASLVDPVCWEKNPLLRTYVGSDWYISSALLRRFVSVSAGGIENEFFHVDPGTNDVGFRCAYRQEPR